MKNSQCLKKGTRSEKILFLIIVASLLAVVVLIALLIGYHQKTDIVSKQKIMSDVCLTPGCVKAAAAILASLDESVDPCDDFYRFACGEWIKTHSIPDDKSSVSLYQEVEDKFNLQFKTLLETKLDGTEPSFIRMTKKYFHTCMDIDRIENEGAVPLKNVLKIFGGWPAVEGEKWDESKFDWLETLISLRNLGCNYNSLLDFSVKADARNSSYHIIELNIPTLGTYRTYLNRGLNDSATAAYYKKMVKAATHLGADESTAKKELLDALHFEMILANYSLPAEERRNISKLYNKYTVKTLKEMAPQIPWIKYFSGLLMNEIHENETLIVKVPELIKKIAYLITRTNKRVIANYILWRLVDDSLPLLSKNWRSIKLEYDTVLNGQSGEKPRWEQCLAETPYKTLEIALSSYYIHHYSMDKTKDKALELVSYVHKEFLRILDESDWMDEKTKEHAKAKANNMIFHIAYPEQLLNNSAVMEFYQSLTLSKDNYFENFLRLNKWSKDNEFSMLKKQRLRKDWKENAADVVLVNAFFHPVDNEISFPVGHLINPFFSPDRPNYLNFGAIGSTIGHEITHGFDDQGRQFDKDGNNVNWWAIVTDENFRKKAQCIINQYSNYTAENGMNLNGVRTQGENIADNGGLKESYWAYQSWVKDNGPELLLPGLKYNQNQLFWIGYAAFGNCVKYRPEKLKDVIISDVHSPNEFRVKGPLSNLAEFSRDFNCPPDSPMNKKHKCQVW